MSEPYPTSQEPFYQIKKSWRRLKKLNQDLQQQANISLDEAIVLCCLSQRCKHQGNVADETGLTATQASRVLSRLENKSLIQRSIGHADKRMMIFNITPTGRQTLEMVTPLGTSHLKM
jgi:MarR family transcriptional regulator, organic hydroperoxide resistance regulator